MDLLGGNEQEKWSVRHWAAGSPQFEAGDVAGEKERGDRGSITKLDLIEQTW